MTEGCELAFEAEAGRSDEDLQIFLLGSAFGALLHQRGALVLHAGAVSVDGEAVLFCGPSGSGKSSLVAALSAAGYPAIADDVCLIQTDGSRPMVAPDGRRLKLWADAMSSLSLGSGCDAAVRPGILKFWVDPQTPASPDAIPLRATYFLRAEAPPYRAGIEPLSTLAALALLRQNAYRPRLVKILGQEADWLERSLSVLRACEAFHLTRRWSFDALPGCIEELQRHWEAGRCAPAL
jgi:energy-coupling factor transporter ATP-binding protein EcfA2